MTGGTFRGLDPLVETSRTPVGAADEPFDYESIPAGYYDDVFRRRRGVQSKWHQLKFSRVARELEGLGRVLDVGCGPGTFAGNTPGHDWVGTDLSSRQIEYARIAYGNTGARFYVATPSAVPDDELSFDAVTMIELIEHLEQALVGETIDEALGRLRPGGKLVLTTPNFHSAWPVMEAAVNRFGDISYAFQHINKFTRHRLHTLLASHGLEDVNAEPYLFAAPFAAAISWRLADWVAKRERGGIERRLGMLLIGSGRKPA